MELKFLKQFEEKSVRIILKNGFRYSGITFEINENGYLQFKDRNGEVIYLEPNAIDMISVMKDGGKNEN